jgi:hypothetical protein
MISPSIAVISLASILNSYLPILLCSSLGVSQHMWVAAVVPSIILYNMCDIGRLKIAASAVVCLSPNLMTSLSLLGAKIIAVLAVYVKLKWPAMIFVTAACLYIFTMALSVEKLLYMVDYCGIIGKRVFRMVILNLTSELALMKMKGEWSFCSPYSRDLVNLSTNHYYAVEDPGRKPQLRWIGATTNQEDEFSLSFPIEKCEVCCRYQYFGDFSDRLALEIQSNKVEVSLLYKNHPVEEFTFFVVAPSRVPRLKFVLEILRDEKNVLFSGLHRNVGSKTNVAHARCYELDEILDLVLVKGFTLRKVNLEAQYDCLVSGGTKHSLLALSLCLLCYLCSLVWGREP